MRLDGFAPTASKRSAISASVASPLSAANATFALNAGEWLRRDLRVISAPGSRRYLRLPEQSNPLIRLSSFPGPSQLLDGTEVGGYTAPDFECSPDVPSLPDNIVISDSGGSSTPAAQKTQQQTAPCPSPPMDTSSNRPYDPKDPKTHNYSVSTSVPFLTAEQAAQLLDLWRNGPNAAPGIPQNTTDFTPTLLANVPYTPNTNWIYIQPITGGWVNVTLPGHYFYSGTVTNTMSHSGLLTTLTSTGTGNTPRWFQNDTLGAAFFEASQLEAMAALAGVPRVPIGPAGGCKKPGS